MTHFSFTLISPTHPPNSLPPGPGGPGSGPGTPPSYTCSHSAALHSCAEKKNVITNHYDFDMEELTLFFMQSLPPFQCQLLNNNISLFIDFGSSLV